MSVVERVRTVVEPLLADRGVNLYDIEQSGATVRVTVDTGDLDVITDLTRAISRALDGADISESRYTLEVSSPGLERTLRTSDHFAGAVGEQVSIKLHASTATEGERRLKGTVVRADADGVTVRDTATGAERTLSSPDNQRARTVFEWGPTTQKATVR